VHPFLSDVYSTFKIEKQMKRILTSALMIALTIGAANAQTAKADKKEGAKKEHRGHHYQDLNLTEAQKAKMAELKAKHKQEREAEKGDRKALMQRHRAEMETLLTPEQKTKMQQKHADKSAAYKKGQGRKGEGKMGRKGGGDRRADVAKELNLSSDQQAKMKTAQTDFRTKMQALRTDNSLTTEQKAAKRKELAQQHQAQVKSILNKEQQQKMQSLRKERPGRNAK
jgi:Spy/CpxP family protein refolding chaperone